MSSRFARRNARSRTATCLLLLLFSVAAAGIWWWQNREPDELRTSVAARPGDPRKPTRGGEATGANPPAGIPGHSAPPGAREPVVEQITIRGKVSLPPGVGLPPEKIRVVSNGGQVAVSGQSDFAVPALRSPQVPSVAAAINEAEEPVLLGVIDASSGPLDLSAKSTAFALAFYDLAFLTMSPEMREEAARKVRVHVDLPKLERAVEESLRIDPDGPLGDKHPELYRQAAAITADVFRSLVRMPAGNATRQSARSPRVPIRLVSTAAAQILVPLMLAAPGDTIGVAGPSGVWVEDDPAHNSPEVVLVNGTFAYYDVTIERTAEGGTTSRSVLLDRARPYSMALNLGTARNARTEDVGDGQLVFQFRKNEELTGFDAAGTSVCALFGIGARSLAGMPGGGTDVMALVHANVAATAALRDFVTLFKNVKGMTWDDAVRANMNFWAVNGYRMISALGPLLVKNYNPFQAQILWKTVSRKLLAGLAFGYACVDVVRMVYDGANAIEQARYGGLQLLGVYPARMDVAFDVTPDKIADGKLGKKYAFTATAHNIPASIIQNMQVVFKYAGGTRDVVDTRPEAGLQVTVRHEFTAPGKQDMNVELWSVGKSRVLVAQKAVPVTIEPPIPAIDNTAFPLARMVYEISGQGETRGEAGASVARELLPSFRMPQFTLTIAGNTFSGSRVEKTKDTTIEVKCSGKIVADGTTTRISELTVHYLKTYDYEGQMREAGGRLVEDRVVGREELKFAAKDLAELKPLGRKNRKSRYFERNLTVEDPLPVEYLYVREKRHGETRTTVASASDKMSKATSGRVYIYFDPEPIKE